jgi:C-terminal processing protease CtpA/Prc
MRRLIVVIFALAVTSSSVAAEPRIERLTKLAEVWSFVRFAHPWLMYKEINWDAPLVHAIPNVSAAKNDEEFANAIGAMLAELHDPATRVVKTETHHEPAKSQLPFTRWEGDDVLVVNLGPFVDRGDYDAVYQGGAAVSRDVAKAKNVVIDLRLQAPDEEEAIPYYLDSWRGLTDKSLPAPAARTTYYSGWKPADGGSSGGYNDGLLLRTHRNVEPAGPTAPRRIVFVINERSPLSPTMVALWLAGRAAIVATSAIGTGADAAANEVTLPGGWTARVRVSELVAPPVTPDVTTTDEAAISRAIELARNEVPLAARPSPDAGSVTPRARAHNGYAAMSYPDLPHRLLAAFRLWSIIDRFYPYKELIGDWNAVLREFIPRFEDAKNADEYATAILEMAAHIEDGHTTISGGPVANILGVATLPIEVRAVEGQYVVTGNFGKMPADVSVGDIVVSIDGEPLATRVARLRKLVTASTETARLDRNLSYSLRGPKDSSAVVELRAANGTTRTTTVTRIPLTAIDYPAAASYRLLDGNIGYADLRRLKVSEVDAMFDAFAKTKAIIFDMRGYPKGTAWSIAPRINTRGAKFGARFQRPQFTGDAMSSGLVGGYWFQQPLPVNDKPKYTGKTVMLIDDRAISQSEHSGLFFEAANGTTFIGTNSAGTNGDVTSMILPGAIRINFTGHDVRHIDGAQLQRVGLVPAVRVEPTIKGIREGKDEVLDRAIGYINELPR